MLAPLLLAVIPLAASPPPETAPNVVLVMTDDQGYGDFGFMGNPVVRTPNLDAMARASARLETFYVSPVCTPTRAALMTGRYCQRTRAIDTWIGRAMMEPDEITVAEVLRDHGWATGIFGKWHLGDCYPMRAMDQGFEESLVHRGGGIGQPADPEGGERKYTDPVLFHNGTRVETTGYCTDVYFDAALAWIDEQASAGRPFFAYIATNAPHGPFHDVPTTLYERYRAEDLGPDRFPQERGHPLPAGQDEDRLARIFAMIENVDENVGRLFAALGEMDVLENTLIIFLNDNGPNSRRYVGGFRGQKSNVYEGGVRSPVFAYWPARLPAGAASDRIAAHIDVMPTILDACGVAPPADARLDGRSLLPLLERAEVAWDDRPLVIQAHRGDESVPYHNMMLRTQEWKLLNASGFGRTVEFVEPNFELYDMRSDPFELSDVAAEHPDVVGRLRAAYDRWFEDVSTTRPDNFAPPRIHVGGAAPSRVVLTRQDWRDAQWKPRATGHWELRVRDAGPYRIRVRFLPDQRISRARLQVGERKWVEDVTPDARDHIFASVSLPVGPTRLGVYLDDATGEVGAYQVIIDALAAGESP